MWLISGLARTVLAGVMACATGTASASDTLGTLTRAGLLDGYLQPVIQSIVDDVTRADRHYRGGRVNRRPGERELGVLVVDTRAPAEKLLDGRVLTLLDRARGGATTDATNGYVLLDGATLRQWAAGATLYTRDYSTMNTAIILAVSELDELRDLWDPQRNIALTDSSPGVGPGEVFAGAVAFAIAHEMGHLRAGVGKRARVPEPPELAGRAAKLRWACPELINQRYVHFRQQERAADAHAVEVLSRIPHAATGAAGRLRYEFGTYWYGLHVLGSTMVRVATTIDDPFYRRVVAQQANPRLAHLLFERARGRQKRDELTAMVFHRSHPADVSRLLFASEQLRRTPRSAFHGDGSFGQDAMVWGLLEARICREAHAQR